MICGQKGWPVERALRAAGAGPWGHERRRVYGHALSKPLCAQECQEPSSEVPTECEGQGALGLSPERCKCAMRAGNTRVPGSADVLAGAGRGETSAWRACLSDEDAVVQAASVHACGVRVLRV